MTARIAGKTGGTYWPWRLALAVVVVCALFAPSVWALEPDELALVVNSNVPVGVALAQFYAVERHVPAGRIIELSLPAPIPEYPPDDISAADYQSKVEAPVRDFLLKNHLEKQVKCLVTFWGMPLRIRGGIQSAEEMAELRSLQTELSQKVQPQIAKDVAALEKLATELSPKFKGGAGGDLNSLVHRAVPAVNDIAKAIPQLTDPAQQRAKFDQFMPILEDLIGTGQALAQTANTRLAALSSEPITNEELANYRDKIMVAQQQIHALEQVHTTAARAAIRKFASDNFGLFAYAQILEQQQNWLNPAESEAALDSELALLWWNDLYPKYRWMQNYLNFAIPPSVHPPAPTLMTARLDGPTGQVVRDLITTSIAVEKTGLKGEVALDARGLSGTDAYSVYDQSIRNFAELLKRKTGMRVMLDNTAALLPDHSQFHVALYCGWYALRYYHPCCQFEPGAVGFHIASLEMISLHDKLETGWCRGLLLDGIDATLGAVAEPYLQSFPRADEFFPLMLTGKLTMAEVYWKTTPMTSWMLCYVGDPLYTPYKADPQLKVQDLPPELQAIFKTAAPPPPRPVPAPSVTGPTLPPPPDRPGI